MLAKGSSAFSHIDAVSGGSCLTKKKDLVQVKNPKTDRYVKIDRGAGRIVAQKKTPGPYKGIPVAPKRPVNPDE